VRFKPIASHGGSFVRSVGGELASASITHTPAMRLEVLQRRTDGRLHWHFRQPELCLFWFSNGIKDLRGTIDGRAVQVAFPGKCKLAIFPAEIEIQGEYSVGPVLDYTVAFLNPNFVSRHLKETVSDTIVAFEHERLSQSLLELSREAASPDNMFELLSEGWATQALAHMYRISRRSQQAPTPIRGGLPDRCLRRLDEYLAANLAKSVTLSELAAIAGLSNRHFLRAFQQSVGATPYAYVLAKRMEEAMRRLAVERESIVEVALSTGFSSAQHFATSFKKATGMTPSAYRHAVSR
jgi:AraC family transcriptional regulator